MNPALWAAKTGLDAQQTEMAVISNNLANVNTTGFKKSRAVFQDLLYQNVSQVGARPRRTPQSPSGLELGTGVQLVATEKIYTQGSLNQTGNSLDLAINGSGFFQVLMPDGTLAYTRDGSFQLSATGQLVTASGYRGAAGDHHSAGRAERHDRHRRHGAGAARRTDRALDRGHVAARATSSTRPACSRNGENLLVQSAASGTPQTGTPGVNGLGTLQQGSSRAPTSTWSKRWSNMIETQRAYEMNTKAIETNDQMLQYLDTNL